MPVYRIFLNVDFQDRNDAKSLGTKWDSNLKCWYMHSDHLNCETLVKRYGENKEVKRQSNKRYREKNKEKIAESNKVYKEKNKDKINEKHNCECGGIYRKSDKARHIRTKKHVKYMEALPKLRN